MIVASGGEKGTGPICAEHPPGRSGKLDLSPFPRLYRLPPIVPGIFEMMLIGYTPETMTDWHRRFVELFEALCDTGYVLDYDGRPTPFVRFLPVGKAIEAHPAALPSDKLEVVLDQFESFGVGHCQCRMAMQVLGRGCGKPLGNCTAMGLWAERAIEAGVMRRVSKKEALDIKREAESHGLVNWIMNVQSTKGQCSCSCCGCCCHAMRTVNEFNAPAAIAPPHFLPRLDPAKCISCGKCAQELPDGRHRRGHAAEDVQTPARALHRLRTVRAGLRSAAGAGDGAGPRLPPSLSQLVLADRPRYPRLADDLLEGLAAAKVGAVEIQGTFRANS